MEEALSLIGIWTLFCLLPFAFLLLTFDCQLSSVLPFQNKIGERGKRARKFGIGAAIEARLRALRVVVCEIAGAVERAGFVNERNDCFWQNGIKFLFRENASHQLARVAMAVFHRIDQRQRNFAFFQIAENGFAKLLR